MPNLLLPVWAALPFAVIIVGVLEYVMRRWWVKRWEVRGFTTVRVVSRTPTLIRTSLAVFAGTTAWWYQISQAGIAVALLVWLAAISWQTDLADHKIPKEPCWIVFVINTILGFSVFVTAGAASAATSLIVTIIIVGILVLVTRGGLGSGDARMLISFTTLAWWSGYTPSLLGLILASLLQAVFRFTVFRNRAQKGGGYPFAPALILGLVVAVILFTTPDTYCEEWVYMFQCS